MGSLRFEGKAVVVTGSSRGLGRALAIEFAREGADVTVCYYQNEAGALETVRDVVKCGRRAIAFQGDVAEHDRMIEMAKKTREEFGRLDILVNNAGIYQDSVIWKMEKSVWDRVLDTDLTGAFNCTKAVINYMREQQWGRILNISSVVGQIGNFGSSNYSAAKAGLFGFTKSVAREVARYNITANALALGYIDVGMCQTLPENVKETILRSIPLGRWGRVDEVTKTALFLASEDAAYITGQVNHLNGGFYI